MSREELNNLSVKLESEAYNLNKGIEALMYRVMPANTDVENDYTLTLLGCLSNQAKLVQEMSEEIEGIISKRLIEH